MMVERFHALDYVEGILILWARWMRATWDGGRPRGAEGFSVRGSTDFEDMLADTERKQAAICDAVIRDLPADQRCALHHTYLNAVWRFRDYDASLAAAKEAVRKALDERGVWLGG